MNIVKTKMKPMKQIIKVMNRFFSVSNIEKNINNNICAHCKFYKPNWYEDFYSVSNKCSYFYIKDNYSGEIKYEYTSVCRADENKCGLNGKFFEIDPNLKRKKEIHSFDKERFNY